MGGADFLHAVKAWLVQVFDITVFTKICFTNHHIYNYKGTMSSATSTDIPRALPTADVIDLRKKYVR